MKTLPLKLAVICTSVFVGMVLAISIVDVHSTQVAPPYSVSSSQPMHIADGVETHGKNHDKSC